MLVVMAMAGSTIAAEWPAQPGLRPLLSYDPGFKVRKVAAAPDGSGVSGRQDKIVFAQCWPIRC